MLCLRHSLCDGIPNQLRRLRKNVKNVPAKWDHLHSLQACPTSVNLHVLQIISSLKRALVRAEMSAPDVLVHLIPSWYSYKKNL